MLEPTYQLTVSSSQASLIAGALDFWMRVHGGQTEALRCVGWRKPKPGHSIDPDAVDDACAAFKLAAFPDFAPNESQFNWKGAREAFNLRKVIEYAVSWHERPLQPGDFPTVNYDGPLESWWETDFRATMHAAPQPLGREEREKRKPLPPDVLVSGIADPVEPVGPSPRGRAARTVRNARRNE